MPRLSDVLLPILEEGRAATRGELDDIKQAIIVLESAAIRLEELNPEAPRFGRMYFDKLGMHIRAGTSDTRRPEIQFIAGGKNALSTGRFTGYSTTANRAGVQVIENGFFDGTNWNIDDTNVNGTIYSTGVSTTAHLFRYLPAGANPITPITLLTLFNDEGGFVWNDEGGNRDFRVEGDTVTDVFKVDAGLDQVLAGTTIAIKERAASQADITTYGQLWVKNDDPNILRYTDGDGTEFIVDMTAV